MGAARAVRAPDETPVPPGCDPDSVVLTFPVPHELDGQRLDRFVHWRIPRLTRQRAAEIVAACAHLSDGTRRHPAERVRAGETVLLVRQRFYEPDAPTDFGVLYRDEAITVVDKPAGLPVHPSATYRRNTLTYALRARFGETAPQIAHRLDKETSGIVVCAQPGPDEVAVKRQFEARKVDKSYLAIVRGVIAADTLVIDAPMQRAGTGMHVRMATHPEGLPARTELRVVERRADRTLVELFPETGRQHQLRVHLASIGHPIVGDKLYGPEGDAVFLELIEDGMSDQLFERLGHDRHALHAASVRFTHPRTGEPLRVSSPLPPDLVALWEDSER